MSDIWKGIVDQDDAIKQLESAARSSASMVNTWLITGPPGSGRITVAKAFVKLLLGADVKIDDNADVHYISPGVLAISVKEIRELLQYADSYPSGKYRVFLIEDADRMTPEAQNALLKAVEEPADFALWIMTAPHSADMLPTIRSRSRIIHLKTPKVSSIKDLLISEGIDAKRAEISAKLSDGHIGVARHLALDDLALDEHEGIADLALGIRTAADAIFAAQRIIDDAEKRSADMPEAQKKRALRDYVDIALQQISTVYRDIALLQVGASKEFLVNVTALPALEAYARSQSLEDTMLHIKRISKARTRISTNVLVNLTLEALFTSLLIPERAIRSAC